jgi:hypothetical protein
MHVTSLNVDSTGACGPEASRYVAKNAADPSLSLGCVSSRNMTVRLVSKHGLHCLTTSVKRITVHAAKDVRTEFSCRKPKEDFRTR